MMKRKNDIVAKLTGGIGGLFAANKVTPIAGRGRVLADSKVQITNIEGKKEIIESKNIIIASGSSPIEISSAIFNDTATTEIYTASFVGSVRCV